MKKVLVISGIFPPDIGGPASYVTDLLKYFNNSDIKINSVICLGSENKKFYYGEIPVYSIRRKSFKLLRAIKTVLQVQLRSRDCDTVFALGLYYEAIIGATVLGSKPVVCKIVGDQIWERFCNRFGYIKSIDLFNSEIQNPRWQFLKLFHRRLIRMSTRVVVPSFYLKNLVSSWGVVGDSMDVIPNAAPVIHLATQSPSFSPIEYDLVTVGRLVPWKGISELIYLAKRMDYSLAIVGDGPLMAELKATAIHIGAPVHFLGSLSRDCTHQVIKRSTAFILNTKYEGLPHVILEAMELGVPVICTSVGGVPELIVNGVNGILVKDGDILELDSAVKSTMTDLTLRNKLIANGKRAVRENFSMAQMLHETRTTLLKSC